LVAARHYAADMTPEPDGTPASSAVPAVGYAPPPPGYPPAPYGYTYARPRPTNGFAIASLIVSIVSFVVCPLIAVVGVVLGYKARTQIRERDEDGDGLALAGIIVGWVGVGLLLLIVLFVLSAIVVPLLAGMS
jgi:hypothetical protein